MRPNTPDKSEMLPCPFCGGPAAAQNYRPRSWGAGCISDECQWQRTAEAYAPSRQKAVELWNTRASSRPADQVPDMVEMKLADLHKAVAAEFPSDEFVFSRQRAIDLALAVHMKIASLQAVPAASGEVGERDA